MQVVSLENVGRRYTYNWPSDSETFSHWIDYQARDVDGEHTVRVGYCTREVYGIDRIRVVIWIDGNPSAEFFGADDFGSSGEVLSEIKVPGERGERICRYPAEAIPERYVMFNTVGLPNRVDASGVHNTWAVAANISDHKTMVALAALRNLERIRFGYA